jgi:hypothetical protein
MLAYPSGTVYGSSGNSEKRPKPIAVVDIPVKVSAELRLLGRRYYFITSAENVPAITAWLHEGTTLNVLGDRPYKFANFKKEFIIKGCDFSGVISVAEYEARILHGGYDEEVDRARLENANKPRKLPLAEGIPKTGTRARGIYDLIASGTNTTSEIHKIVGGTYMSLFKCIQRMRVAGLIESQKGPKGNALMHQVVQSNLPRSEPTQTVSPVSSMTRSKQIIDLIHGGTDTPESISEELGCRVENARYYLSILKGKGLIERPYNGPAKLTEAGLSIATARPA